MTLKDLFPNIIVLSLDKRYYSHAVPLVSHMKERFGIDIEVFLAGDGEMVKDIPYSHVDVNQIAPRYPNSSTYHTWNTSRCYNAWLCHNKMIQIAKQQGYSNVLLLEDDVFFEAHTEAVLDVVGEIIDHRIWDFLYMGFCSFRADVTHYEERPIVVPIQGNCIGGFHCAGIKNTIYDELINWKPIGCYDSMIEAIPNRYIVLPKLGEQKDGLSSIEGGWIARENVQDKLVKVRAIWPNI